MVLFLCVNDRKQTLEIILLSLLLPHNKKTHFNWMHFYYFDSCVPEERADTHQPMDDIIGKKKVQILFVLLLWNSVSALPVHWGLCINIDSLKVATVSFIFPWTSCVPLGIFINTKLIPFTCRMRKIGLPWAVNKIIFMKEPSRVLGKLFLLQLRNVEYGRRLYPRGFWWDNSKYSKNSSCN